MELQRKARRPLLSFNQRRQQLYVLSQEHPYNLFLKIQSNDRPRSLYLDFVPKSLLSLSDYILVQGSEKLVFYDIDSDIVEILLQAGLEILQIQAHPLSDRSIGVLTKDSFFSIYSLPSSVPDLTINLQSLRPISFTFFNEKPNSLFAFGICLLSSNSMIHVLSPVLPHSFKMLKEKLNLKSTCQIEGNSYKIYEKNLLDWAKRLENLTSPESKHWKKVIVNDYSYLPPVPRGPCFSFKEQAIRISVINDSSPAVLAVWTKGAIKVIVATGDLTPSFSDGSPSIEWEVLEVIAIDFTHIFHSREFLICTSQRALLKIDLPWLELLRESYSSKQRVKHLPKSVVSVLQDNIEVFDLAVFYKNYNAAFCYSLDFGYEVADLIAKRAPEDLVDVNKAELINDFTLPKVNFVKFDDIRRALCSLPQISGDEEEVKNAYKVFNDFVRQQGFPLHKRIEEIKNIMENSQRRFENLNRSYEDVNAKLSSIESYQVDFEKKIEAINRNDEIIRERIQKITNIQQNIKKPLTPVEKELSMRLSELDNRACQLRNSMVSSVKELKGNQDKIRSLCYGLQADSQLASNIERFRFQLGEISDDLVKFQDLRLLK